MEATVGVLSAQVGGEVVGNPDLLMKDAQALGKAVGCEVSFLGSDTRIGEIEGSQAGAILIARKRLDELSATVRAQHTFIVVVDVLDAFLTILRQFRTARAERSEMSSSQLIRSVRAVRFSCPGQEAMLRLGWRWVFPVLVIGPAFGIVALWNLVDVRRGATGA